MGRRKLRIEKLEKAIARKTLFARRKNMFIKKAIELSVLCNTDVGVIMFSPAGDLITFSSNGTVNGLLLRFLTQPYHVKGSKFKNGKQFLSSIMYLKYEEDTMELLAEEEALEKEIETEKQRLIELQESTRYYNPIRYPIESTHHAEMSEKAISDALIFVRESKEKLLKSHASYEATNGIEETMVHRQSNASANEPQDMDESSEAGRMG